MGKNTLKDAIKTELGISADIEIANCDLREMSNAEYIAKSLVARAKLDPRSNVILDIAKLAGETDDKMQVSVSIDKVLGDSFVDTGE